MHKTMVIPLVLSARVQCARKEILNAIETKNVLYICALVCYQYVCMAFNVFVCAIQIN